MREEHMTNHDIATEARRIASERVPPTTQPTPWWEIARQDAEHELTRAGVQPARLIVLAIALAVFCWGSAALAWDALWR
jgi:hypothetical protein